MLLRVVQVGVGRCAGSLPLGKYLAGQAAIRGHIHAIVHAERFYRRPASRREKFFFKLLARVRIGDDKIFIIIIYIYIIIYIISLICLHLLVLLSIASICFIC